MLSFDNEKQKDKNIFKDKSQSEYVLMLLLIIIAPLFCFKKPSLATFHLLSYFTYRWNKKVFKLSG